jgi:hypothetical protein
LILSLPLRGLSVHGIVSESNRISRLGSWIKASWRLLFYATMQSRFVLTFNNLDLANDTGILRTLPKGM